MTAPQKSYLVVDDDSTNNLICEFTIRRYDKSAKICSFLEPEKALKYITREYSKTEEPNSTVVFLDVNMPTMTGFEFLDEFLRFDRGVQEQFIIYMLSSSVEDFSMQAKKYPIVAGFLAKPLQISHLEDVLAGGK